MFVGPGSAARIVRSGIWWWLAVLGGDNCHSGGVEHPGFVGSAPAATHNLALLCYCWAVFTLLKRWVYIGLDRMSFFKRCAITSFGHGVQTLGYWNLKIFTCLSVLTCNSMEELDLLPCIPILATRLVFTKTLHHAALCAATMDAGANFLTNEGMRATKTERARRKMSWPALLLMTSSPGRIRDKVAPGTNSPQPSLYLIVNKLPSLSLSLSLSHTHSVHSSACAGKAASLHLVMIHCSLVRGRGDGRHWKRQTRDSTVLVGKQEHVPHILYLYLYMYMYMYINTHKHTTRRDTDLL